MERTKNVRRNIIWGIFNKIILSLLPFISRTIIIYKLGELYLGVNSLFTSILGVLSLSELGISAAIVYSMYKPLANNDTDKVCALLHFYRKCYRVIGLVIGVLGLAIMPFIKFFIKGDYPSDINIYVVYLIFLIYNVISYLMFAYKNSLLQATQRTDIISNISTITAIIQYSIQIPLLIITSNYYFYILIIIFTTLVNNIITHITTKKLYPQYVCKGKLEKHDYSDFKIQVAGLFIRKIGDVILSSSDNIVISTFLGLAILARYNNYYLIITALFGFISILSTSLKNTVGNILVTESKQRNYKDFKTFDMMYTFIISMVAICFMNYAQPFMTIWMGDNYLLNNNVVIMLSIYIFIFKWCDILYVYQEAMGIWWKTKWIPLIAAITNLIINIITVNFIGLYGVIISTIVSILLIYDIGYAIILYREYFSTQGSIKEIYFRKLYYIVCMAVVVIYSNILTKFDPQNVFAVFFYRTILCVIPSCIILLLLYTRVSEFKDCKKYIIKFIKK